MTNTTIQSLQDAAKAVFRGKFTVTQEFFKKREGSQNNPTYYLKELEK